MIIIIYSYVYMCVCLCTYIQLYNIKKNSLVIQNKKLLALKDTEDIYKLREVVIHT